MHGSGRFHFREYTFQLEPIAGDFQFLDDEMEGAKLQFDFGPDIIYRNATAVAVGNREVALFKNNLIEVGELLQELKQVGLINEQSGHGGFLGGEDGNLSKKRFRRGVLISIVLHAMAEEVGPLRT